MTLAPSPTLSYSRQDWQRGYESQPGEFSYWVEEVEGQIPLTLEGTLFRNGPGLLDVNGAPIHHPFDGDGLICAFTFQQGRVHFRDRYVRTVGYVTEQQTGKISYRGVFGTQKPGGPLANAFDLKLKNIANTNILYWGGKLLALWEAAEPHRLDPATLETLGLDDLDGLLQPGDAFSAHPRIDPGSDFSQGQPRLVNFGVKAGLSSTIRLYEFDTSGQLMAQQARSIPGFAFMHDFAITPNYYVFMQNPIRFNPLPFLLGMKGAGQCLQSDPSQLTRILLIPRDANQPICSVETDPCFVFHHANAFEQDGMVYLDSICYPELGTVDGAVDFKQIDFATVPAGQLFRFTINPSQPRAERHCLEARTAEFPSLHPAKVGRKPRYLYQGVTHGPTGNAPLQAIMKLDLETGDRLVHSFAPRGFISEPVFVPRSISPDAAEDEGWVITLVYNAERHASDLVILDAAAWSVAAIARLNQHIPYGLHGSFVRQVMPGAVG